MTVIYELINKKFKICFLISKVWFVFKSMIHPVCHPTTAHKSTFLRQFLSRGALPRLSHLIQVFQLSTECLGSTVEFGLKLYTEGVVRSGRSRVATSRQSWSFGRRGTKFSCLTFPQDHPERRTPQRVEWPIVLLNSAFSRGTIHQPHALLGLVTFTPHNYLYSLQ